MARSHGRIASAIWNDPDFIALDAHAQRLFMFLLSQPDLSHAGLIPMRVKRWSKKAGDLSSGAVEDQLETLANACFIVADDDTEEVLIRTFVRNDGVYKQPKVMLRMREDARQIESPLLRAVFRAELDRIPMDDLNSNPGGPRGDQPSTRQAVQAVIDTLREDFADAGNLPADTLPDTLPDTPYAGARLSPVPLPPTPVPHPPSPRATPLSDKSDVPANTTAAFDAFWDAYGKKVGKGAAVKAFAAALKRTGNDRRASELRLVSAAADHRAWHERAGTPWDKVPHPTTWLNRDGWLDERPEPRAATAAPNAAQQRMQGNLDVVAGLAAEEHGEDPWATPLDSLPSATTWGTGS